jgi:hypothetical protein
LVEPPALDDDPSPFGQLQHGAETHRVLGEQAFAPHREHDDGGLTTLDLKLEVYAHVLAVRRDHLLKQSPQASAGDTGEEGDITGS